MGMSKMKIVTIAYSLILAISGIFFTYEGAELALAGGSLYYFIFGLLLLLAAFLHFKADVRASVVLAATFLLTICWALWEVGLNYWGLFPRVLTPLGFLIISLGVVAFLRPAPRFGSLGVLAAAVVTFLAFFGFSFKPFQEVIGERDPSFKIAQVSNAPDNWAAYGRTVEGTRYGPFNQINRDNVRNLKIAWTYRTGRPLDPGGWASDQNTPLQIDNTIYSCTPQNVIHAIDATTGKNKWISDPGVRPNSVARCRGVSFFRDPDAAKGSQCADRIIATTIDARLHEIDATTGARCTGFGENGFVNLSDRVGQSQNLLYYQTSAPLVARNLIVVGGWVSDNQHRGEPSGVIRAFDVRTGAVVWAWDLGNPQTTREPQDGQTYTLGTPNMWSHAAFDDKLGLIFLPLGNATPDYFSTGRPPHSESYNSALVALDIESGRERWKFQTVHTDLWDYDLPSQPALVDMPNDKGEMVPSVIQLTKRGQIFAFDRRTGQPITRVEEKPVPQTGHVSDELPSPTQPYSVGMPTIGGGALTEASAWGMTSFDQLWCRIDFRKRRYDGEFTLPGLTSRIQYPSAMGGMNWGSASYDPVNSRIFVNDIRIAGLNRLMLRDEFNEYVKTHKPTLDGHGVAAMEGTPYGEVTSHWMSPFGVPCSQPPFGTISAIDLKTRKVVWQGPADTAKNLGPMGIALGLPMRMGSPTYAGTMTTAGGLVFFAGGQDNYLRAFDAETGQELWKGELPVGSSATPMTYVSPIDGKQYVLISAGGAAHSPTMGDYVIAFSL